MWYSTMGSKEVFSRLSKIKREKNTGKDFRYEGLNNFLFGNRQNDKIEIDKPNLHSHEK